MSGPDLNRGACCPNKRLDGCIGVLSCNAAVQRERIAIAERAAREARRLEEMLSSDEIDESRYFMLMERHTIKYDKVGAILDQRVNHARAVVRDNLPAVMEKLGEAPGSLAAVLHTRKLAALAYQQEPGPCEVAAAKGRGGGLNKPAPMDGGDRKVSDPAAVAARRAERDRQRATEQAAAAAAAYEAGVTPTIVAAAPKHVVV
jgi:hypothetical protein